MMHDARAIKLLNEWFEFKCERFETKGVYTWRCLRHPLCVQVPNRMRFRTLGAEDVYDRWDVTPELLPIVSSCAV